MNELKTLVHKKKKFLIRDEQFKNYYLWNSYSTILEKKKGNNDFSMIKILDSTRFVTIHKHKILIVEIKSGKILKTLEFNGYEGKLEWKYFTISGNLILICQTIDSNLNYLTLKNLITLEEKNFELEHQVEKIILVGNRIVLSYLPYDAPYDLQTSSIEIYDLEFKLLLQVEINQIASGILPLGGSHVIIWNYDVNYKTKYLTILNLINGKTWINTFEFRLDDIKPLPNGQFVVSSSSALSELRKFYKTNFSLEEKNTKPATEFIIEVSDDNLEVYDSNRILLITQYQIQIYNFITKKTEYLLKTKKTKFSKAFKVPLTKEENKEENLRISKLLEPLMPIPKDLIILIADQL